MAHGRSACRLGLTCRTLRLPQGWTIVRNAQILVLSIENEMNANKRAIVASAGTWFVYILRCADDSLYTGIAKDVSRRCEQHNGGTASRYTRSRLPVSVAYQENHVTQSLALKREAAIKAMSRQEKDVLIRLSG